MLEWRERMNEEGATGVRWEDNNFKTLIFHRRCNKTEREMKEKVKGRELGEQRMGSRSWQRSSPKIRYGRWAPISSWPERREDRSSWLRMSLLCGAALAHVLFATLVVAGRSVLVAHGWRTFLVLIKATALAKRVSVCITYSTTASYVVVVFLPLWICFLRDGSDPVIQFVSDVTPVSHSALAERDRKETGVC